MELLHTAIRAAIEAGHEILKVYNSSDFNIEIKDDQSPLTRADRAAHDIIEEYLGKTGIPVLSEEDSKNHSWEERRAWTRCWIVDPLDGTKEFIKRNGEFTVNIALAEAGVPVVGIIYVPVTGVLYFSTKEKKSYKLEKADLYTPVRIAQILVPGMKQLPCIELPEDYTIVGSRSHSSPETEAYVKEMEARHGAVDFVASGSSLKFCLVAEGKAHAYPRFAPTMEWDTAAGQAILEAAGGKVLEWPSGVPMRYNRENLRNGWFLASI